MNAMRPTWRLVPTVVVLVLAAVPTVSSGAVGKTQLCDAPTPPAQSGRATITPGVNDLKSPQKIAMTISLFSCSPAFATRGAGSLKTTITIKAGQTCSLLSAPHTVHAATTIKWKDNYTSVVALTLSLSGASHNVNATGVVSHGLFKNHPVTGEFHDTDVVSARGGTPTGSEIDQACRNKLPPKTHGRVSIDGLTFVTTKPFDIS
jgi:hypothetical protein